MKRVQHGSTVTISYIGTLDNGRIFDSTDQHGQLTFSVGQEQLFPALEQAIIGMKAGDVKNIVLTEAQAYGSRSTENIISVSRECFPAGKEILVGQKLSIEFKGGKARIMLVTGFDEDKVTLDGNHPLAGLELTFALKVERVE